MECVASRIKLQKKNEERRLNRRSRTYLLHEGLSLLERRTAMTNRSFLTFGSVVAFIFGLGFILMPARLLSMYNVTVNEAGLLIGQLFGATLLGFGVLNWSARGFGMGEATQAVLTANLVTDAIGFIIALIGQLGGVPGINALGWSTVVIYLILAAGFAYLRFFAR
jgi:hypothetical protein